MEAHTKKSLLIVLLSIFCFFSILFLWQHSLLLSTIFLLAILFILFLEKNKTNIFFVIILFISCATLEIIAVHLNIWRHSLPDFLGIPLWIPLGWALFGLLARHLYMLLNHWNSTNN